jgi:hypothetical protein
MLETLTTRRVSNGDTNFNVIAPEPRPGEQITFKIINARAVNNSPTAISFHVGSFDNEGEFLYSASPAAEARVIHTAPALTIGYGTRLVVRFVGSTNGDNLVCSFFYERARVAQ